MSLVSFFKFRILKYQFSSSGETNSHNLYYKSRYTQIDQRFPQHIVHSCLCLSACVSTMYFQSALRTNCSLHYSASFVVCINLSTYLKTGDANNSIFLYKSNTLVVVTVVLQFSKRILMKRGDRKYKTQRCNVIEPSIKFTYNFTEASITFKEEGG